MRDAPRACTRRSLAALGLVAVLAAGGPVRAEPDAGPGLPSDGGAAPVEAGSPRPVRAVAGHVVVEQDREITRITEVFVLEAAEPAESAADPVELPLPGKATRVEVEQGDDLLSLSKGRLVLGPPSGPGRQAIAYSYELSTRTEGWTIVDHTMAFDVEGLRVIWPAGGRLTVRAMGFAERGRMSLPGSRAMHVLERARLPRGARLALAVGVGPEAGREEPRPAGRAARDPIGPVRLVTMSLSALVVLAGLVYGVARRR